jgi:hypothetical protein
VELLQTIAVKKQIVFFSLICIFFNFFH